MPFCDVFQFRNGKIVAGRSYFDAATMMRQLGLLAEGATGQSGGAGGRGV